MNITFKRSGMKNYLVIEKAETGNADFREKMIIRNRIPYLARMTPQSVDGEISYYYDIQGNVRLDALFECRAMTYREIAGFLRALAAFFPELERYMLSPEEVLFAPSCIWVTPDTLEPEFIYVPGAIPDSTFSINELAVFLTEHVDGGDREAAALAYGYLEYVENGYLIPNTDMTEKPEKTEVDRTIRSDIPTGNDIPDIDLKRMEESTVEEMRAVFEPRHPKLKRVYAALGTVAALSVTYVLLVLYPEWFPFVLNDDEYMILGVAIAIVFAIMLIAVMCFYNKTRSEAALPATDTVAPEPGFDPDSCRFSTVSKAYDAPADRPSALSEPYDTKEKISLPDDGRTVLLRGPRFSFADKPACPVLEQEGGSRIMLDHFPFVVGKMKNRVDEVINDEGISRIHAMLKEQDGRYFISDLNSLNGTGLNGRLLEVNETAEITNGDTVSFANTSYVFRCA